MEKQYKIEEREFVQREMVVGQLEQLGGILAEIPFDLFIGMSTDKIDPTAIRGFLRKLSDDTISKLLSIVLIPRGIKLEDKDIEEVGKFVKWNCPLEMGADIIVDFFVCNPPSKLNLIWRGLSERIQKLGQEEKENSNPPTSDGTN